MNAPPDIIRWFVFTARPGRELEAAESLEPIAEAVRVPVEVRHIRRHRRANATRKIHVPLLAGYVFGGFARGDGDVPWREIRGLAGVRGVLATRAGRPLEIPPDWRERMDYSRVELPDGGKRPLGWNVGDMVTLTHGPLQGHTGVVEKLIGERARLILKLFNESVPVEICVADARLAHT